MFGKSWNSQEPQEDRFAEGLAMGMLEARREDLLRVLALRFPGAPLHELTAFIRTATDLDGLSRWFDAAVLAASPEIFRAMVERP
jgi:hypothetical protein